MRFFCGGGWRAAFLLLAAAGPILQAAPPAERENLAGEVHAIFAAKCLECHGADLRHPKGHFGYVLDLARVAANPKMVIPGDADGSELYQLVLDDEMPGDEATVPPLTPPEKETVKRWIEAGAPALPAAPKAVPRVLTFWQRLVRAIGQFHPPLAHFPIAFLMAAAPAELMWKLTRRRGWRSTVRFCVITGAATATVTAGLGWCDAAFLSRAAESGALLAWHRWVGTGTAVLALLTAILSEIAHSLGRPRWWRHCFRAALLFTVAAVAAAGYLGGALIYGLDHFRW